MSGAIGPPRIRMRHMTFEQFKQHISVATITPDVEPEPTTLDTLQRRSRRLEADIRQLEADASELLLSAPDRTTIDAIVGELHGCMDLAAMLDRVGARIDDLSTK